jgi:hypothetical protein
LVQNVRTYKGPIEPPELSNPDPITVDEPTDNKNDRGGTETADPALTRVESAWSIELIIFGRVVRRPPPISLCYDLN